ncbi:MAG: hypothetical protein ACFFED_15105 [Candidatus Thorarchaeota archaeon]
MKRSINWWSVLLIVTGVSFLILGTFIVEGFSPEIGYAMLVTGFILIAGICLVVANPDETSLANEIGRF